MEILTLTKKLSLLVFILILFKDFDPVIGQNLQQALFKVSIRNKDVILSSRNLIVTFKSESTRTCVSQSNTNPISSLAVMRSNGSCSLYREAALNELVDSLYQTTTVFQKQKKLINSVGLVNYWPIISDLRDYVSMASLSPGVNLLTTSIVRLDSDRFGNSNSSLFMSNGYYLMPPGMYFNGSFSVLAWIKINSIRLFSRLIDCGNGMAADNVVLALTNNTSGRPYIEIANGASVPTRVVSDIALSVGVWHHVAWVVNELKIATFYVNGTFQGNGSTTFLPNPVNRTKCYIGRSSWHPSDRDADMYTDEIKIYI